MMKNKSDNFEHILKKALLEEASLSADLVHKTREKLYNREVASMRPNKSKPLKWAAGIAAGLLFTSITAFATWQLLTPSEVASEFNDEGLTVAFDSEDAIHINETLTSEGYSFTLLSIVSGEDLTDTLDFGDEVRGDRTYAVVAIKTEDGTPITDSTSSFFISPYIRGFAPWQVNIASLDSGGGGQEAFIDGVSYLIIDTANLEVFADHGVYLGISLGRFSFEAFDFDGSTGALSLNPNFNGPAVLFELPLDIALADEARAQEILDAIFFVEEADEITDEDTEAKDDIGFTSEFTRIDENGEEIVTRMYAEDFIEMTYDEVADFLQARIDRDIENGEPEAVIVGGQRDRENTLRTMRDYNIEFAEVWYDDYGMSISLTVPQDDE